MCRVELFNRQNMRMKKGIACALSTCSDVVLDADIVMCAGVQPIDSIVFFGELVTGQERGKGRARARARPKASQEQGAGQWQAANLKDQEPVVVKVNAFALQQLSDLCEVALLVIDVVVRVVVAVCRA